MGFPGGSDSKEFAFNAGDLGLIPESGGSPGEGNGYPLQYSCLGNPWTKVPGGPSSMGLQRVRLNWVTDTFIFSWFHRIGVFIRRITTELTLPSLLLFFFFFLSPCTHKQVNMGTHSEMVATYKPRGDVWEWNFPCW